MGSEKLYGSRAERNIRHYNGYVTRGKKRRGELDAVLTLQSHDIRPLEALKLLEYEEIDLFLEEWDKMRDRKKRIEELRTVELIRKAIISTQSKKAAQSYTQWRLNILDSIEESFDDKRKTIFDLFRNPKEKKETIFTRLKKEAKK